MNKVKLLILTGGPDGCGKSSIYEALRSRKNALPFLNADLIAVASHGVPGVHGELEAGRIMLDQVENAIESDRSFALETTMSGRGWVKLIERARSRGYKIISVFVSLDTVERSLSRIAERKSRGGHDIPEATVRRRWKRCHVNFWHLYKTRSDSWYVFDNCSHGAVIVAQKVAAGVRIYDKALLERVEEYAKG